MTYLTNQKFCEFPLDNLVLKGLESAGFEYCTPIQSLSLPLLLQGKNIAGQAQTGTGKTIAFLSGLFHYLLTQSPLPQRQATQPRALILAPTRELAVQIHHDAGSLSHATGLKLGLLFGGQGYEKQSTVLSKGVDIVIGTPGRVIDFYKQKVLSLSGIQAFVLDEADRMFDLGFMKDLQFLLRNMPAAHVRLNMLFSATLSMRVQELGYEYMGQPVHVRVETQQKIGQRIQEELFYPSNEDKKRLLLTLIEEDWPEKGIIFANTKISCEAICAQMQAEQHRVGLLTGDIPQKVRLLVLEQFADGVLDFLVATDVAARGLHIPEVSHVFNYDLPDDPEDYVHRIGRTGRAGSSGHAISFACEDYAINLPAIEAYIEHSIPVTKYDPHALMTLIGFCGQTPKRRKKPASRDKINQRQQRRRSVS